jgi:misacylated tRNA(Ala) deacylase
MRGHALTATIMVTHPLYDYDAYRRDFTGSVTAVDRDRSSIALDRTAMYPGGGGQPCDYGELSWTAAETGRDPNATGDVSPAWIPVVQVRKLDGVVWHQVPDEAVLPHPGTEVAGRLDWERRHRLMRMHTAMHVINGVIWLDHAAQVTGVDFGPDRGRIDVALPGISTEFGRQLEDRVNDVLNQDLPIRVEWTARAEADQDPALIRSKASLIPRSVDPLRVINIVGLDRQADGGTHVRSCREVGRIRVVKTESKGKGNKRIRIELSDE